MESYLEFEKPIATLEKKLQDLRDLSRSEGMDFATEIASLETKVAALIDETYGKLTPWQRVLVSRHPNRPYCLDYIEALFPDFMELHGDRAFRDDPALICGIAHWPPQAQKKDVCDLRHEGSILILGHQKGRTTKQKMQRNFGMARPEGYRKAIRLLELAARMRIPVLTLVDTPGAYPSLDAEERGQSQAIAESIRMMFDLEVPIASVVIGEGGSGGALAIGCANQVMMMEYSTYSVISPEGCASILWSDATLAERASEKLRLSAEDVMKTGVIDSIIPEPKGGAHRSWEQAFENVREALMERFDPMIALHRRSCAARLSGGKAVPTHFSDERVAKFRAMGAMALGRTKTDPVAEEEAPRPRVKSKVPAEKGKPRAPAPAVRAKAKSAKAAAKREASRRGR
ncbi:MAG: acetyl-CoA carboxylase carboxyltransferase subunit alpha [Bdellovibrionales bacterium]|nr:acetyl-CoA carboxylase carboxyltransferase subunit alpha [Bdellovibrionales bacterium]